MFVKLMYMSRLKKVRIALRAPTWLTHRTAKQERSLAPAQSCPRSTAYLTIVMYCSDWQRSYTRHTNGKHATPSRRSEQIETGRRVGLIAESWTAYLHIPELSHCTCRACITSLDFIHRFSSSRTSWSSRIRQRSRRGTPSGFGTFRESGGPKPGLTSGECRVPWRKSDAGARLPHLLI